MEQLFQPLNNLSLTTLIAGGSNIGGSEGRLKEKGAAGFARENEETPYNVGKGIDNDRKGIEVRYFPRAMKCEPSRSGGGKSKAQYCTDACTNFLSKCALHPF